MKNKKYHPFQFKQFSIQQNSAAMKIGTDGILLGAWVKANNKKHGLDIGTGTGVIAIMQCQKNDTINMDAIDISKNAIADAEINFKNCPWNKRLVKLIGRCSHPSPPLPPPWERKSGEKTAASRGVMSPSTGKVEKWMALPPRNMMVSALGKTLSSPFC